MAAAKGNNYARKYTDKQIDDILDGVLDYAMNSDGIYITTYLWKKYKRPKWWLNDLSKYYPKVKETLPQIKALIAAKISNHCFKGDRNSAFGERILPMYCEDYRQETERKASLAKQSESNMQVTADQFVKAIAESNLLSLLKQDK